MLDKPLDAVATHIHYDHVGGLHEFETRLMHEAEAAQMNLYEEFGTLVAADFGGTPFKPDLPTTCCISWAGRR